MFKKIKLIGMICLVMAAIVAFSSCEKEKKQGENPQESIIGTWQVTKAYINDEWWGDEEGEKWIFKDNGTCNIHMFGGEVNYSGTYYIKENILTIDVYARCYYDIDYEDRFLSGTLALDINKGVMSLSGTMKEEHQYCSEGEWDFETERFNLRFNFIRL